MFLHNLLQCRTYNIENIKFFETKQYIFLFSHSHKYTYVIHISIRILVFIFIASFSLKSKVSLCRENLLSTLPCRERIRKSLV